MALFSKEAPEDYQAQFTPLAIRYLVMSAVLGGMLIYVLWYVGCYHLILATTIIILVFITCLFTSRKRVIGLSVLTGLIWLFGVSCLDSTHMMNHHFYGYCGPHGPNREASDLQRALADFLEDHGSYPLDGGGLLADGGIVVNPFNAKRFREAGVNNGKPTYRDELTGQLISEAEYLRVESIQPIPLGITDFNRNFRYVPTITVTESGEQVCLEYELIFYGRKFNYISPRLECEEVLRVSGKAPRGMANQG